MSGIELMRRARRTRPRLPVVLCSGYAPDAEAIGDADTVFLAKPFTSAELVVANSAVADEAARTTGRQAFSAVR